MKGVGGLSTCSAASYGESWKANWFLEVMGQSSPCPSVRPSPGLLGPVQLNRWHESEQILPLPGKGDRIWQLILSPPAVCLLTPSLRVPSHRLPALLYPAQLLLAPLLPSAKLTCSVPRWCLHGWDGVGFPTIATDVCIVAMQFTACLWQPAPGRAQGREFHSLTVATEHALSCIPSTELGLRHSAGPDCWIPSKTEQREKNGWEEIVA